MSLFASFQPRKL